MMRNILLAALLTVLAANPAFSAEKEQVNSIGMKLMRIEPGSFRFMEKPPEYIFLLIGIEFPLQIKRLDGNRPVDFRVTALVDHAHGALANFLVDTVPSQVAVTVSTFLTLRR